MFALMPLPMPFAGGLVVATALLVAILTAVYAAHYLIKRPD